MQPHLSVFLNVARWGAAFLVLISHLRLLLFSSYGEVSDKNPLLMLFYIVTGLGHEAVIIFFIISGLLVGGITLDRWRKSGANLSRYFIHRFSRIYTVLLPALILGALLDWLGAGYFNASEIYTDAGQHQITSVKEQLVNDIGVQNFIGNLLMLHPEYVPILGSNGPLWSLSYEWWYYTLFAAAACFFLSNTKRRKALSLSALALIGFFAHAHLLLWGVIWLMGVATWFYKDSSLPKPPMWLSLPLFAASLLLSRYHTHAVVDAPPASLLELFAYDAFIGVSFSCLILSVAKCTRMHIPFPALHDRLADFSFTLYAVHFPVLLLFSAMAHDLLGMPYHANPDMRQFAYLSGFLLLLYALCWGMAQITEKHTSRVRKWLEARLES